MGESSQERALTPETLLSRAVEQGEIQELDGNGTLEVTVAAPRAPHRTHAADAERHVECVRADRLTGK